MTTVTIPFSLPGFLCHGVKVVGAGIELEAEATLNYAFCPACGVRSTSIHSHYQRHISDLPLNGTAMHLRLRVRRFRCRNPGCLRQIFTERIFVVGGMFVLPFVVDATYTIFRRWRHGENILQAHCAHLYQRLVLRGHSHGGVTGLYGFMSVICVASGVLYYTGETAARSIALSVVIVMSIAYIIGAEYFLLTKPSLYHSQTKQLATVIDLDNDSREDIKIRQQPS